MILDNPASNEPPSVNKILKGSDSLITSYRESDEELKEGIVDFSMLFLESSSNTKLVKENEVKLNLNLNAAPSNNNSLKSSKYSPNFGENGIKQKNEVGPPNPFLSKDAKPVNKFAAGNLTHLHI
jgi:hypothetical protein